MPAYNEQRRIGNTLRQVLEYLRSQHMNAEVVVVDDGSRDATVEIVKQIATESPEVRLLQNPGNRGKGYAVQNGMLHARGQVLLFTDADLSCPISESAKLFAALVAGADVAMGSRWLNPALQTQRQSAKRRVLSRIYNLFLRMVLGFSYRDTQCGFKAFTRAAAQKIFPLQRIHRWGFDPELIFIADRMDLKVAEIPVIWGHDDLSKIHPVRDGLRMGAEVLKIRWLAQLGKYNPAATQPGTK